MKNFYQSEPDIKNLKKQEIESVFLNDWDKKYLEIGAIGMIKKIYTDFENNFPDVIILPERGARPLYYLLSPIFKRLNVNKKTKVPKFVYFSVGQRPKFYLSFQEQYNGIDIKNSEELKEIMREDHPYMSETEIQDAVDKENVEKVMISRENMRERAKEINEKNLSNFKLAIVDEFLGNGNTTREIRRAFDNEAMPAYTLVALSGSDDSAILGYSFNEEDDSIKNSTVGGYSFSFEKAEDAIGIKKSFDQKYTNPIQGGNVAEQEKLIQDKKLLRAEMRSFGEKLANKISAVL